MQVDIFYQTLSKFAAQAPEERYRSLAELHSETLKHYLEVIRRITPQHASRPLAEGRTITQVVGHIAEWDRAAIIAVGEILAGITWPRLMAKAWSMAQDGQIHDFATVDEFNAYYAGRHAAQSWQTIQTLTIDLAEMLYRLFTTSDLMPPERLEKTQQYEGKIGDINLSIPCGWYLWMITIEHIAVEHIADIEQSISS